MLEVEIIPGESIGPIQLGMTQDEIAKLGKHTGSDRVECEYDSSGRCSKISIRPVCRANRFLPQTELFSLMLAGHDLLDLTEEQICNLCGIGKEDMQHEFMARSYPTIGLLLEWDIYEGVSGDPYRVGVFAKQPPSKTQRDAPK